MERQEQKQGIFYKLDWYTVIFQDDTIDNVLDWLKLKFAEDIFYESMYEVAAGFDDNFVFRYEGIRIEAKKCYFYGHSTDVNLFHVIVPKIRVDISGQGLDYIRQALGYNPDVRFRDPAELPPNAHITRADFAFDLVNYKPEFLDQLIDYLQTNHTESDRITLQGMPGSLSYSIRTGGQKTVYLGTPQSRQLLRVYDKRIQLTDPRTHIYFQENPYGNPDSWIRIELQTRAAKAHGLCLGVSEGCDNTFLSIFRYIFDYYAFTDLSSGYKRLPAQFWLDLWDWEVIPRIIQNLYFL